MIDRSIALGPGRPARVGLAHLVLAIVTGLPLRSTSSLVPHPDDESGPFVGI